MSEVRNAQVWSIVGGQAGSEGKGKVAAQLAFKEKPQYAVCAFSPNAGHTAYDLDGEKHVFHQVPVGVLNPETVAVIGPGSLIDPHLLMGEIQKLHLGPDRVKIDPRAWVVFDSDKDNEARYMNAISSTCQGVGSAMERRVSRRGKSLSGLDLYLSSGQWQEYLVDTTELLMSAWERGDRIQIEGSQGVDIDLIHGIQYPYCTSRSVIAGAVAGDSGFPARLVDRVIMVNRTYPIRVGNAFDKKGAQIGWSGPIPSDSDELTWEEMTSLSGSPEPLLETTTVTKKIRRIFTWSPSRFKRAWWLHGATDVYLNFVNYVDWKFNRTTNWSEVPKETKEILLSWINRQGIPLDRLCSLGTGPMLHQYLDPKELE